MAEWYDSPAERNLMITLLVAFAVSWLIGAFRIARMARQYNRRPWVWFLLTLIGTPIPAMITFWVDYFRSNRTPPKPTPSPDSLDAQPTGEQDDRSEEQTAVLRRCPHCGEVLSTAPEGECPACRMTLQEDHYA